MNVLFMYGGKSCEHDISIITAMQAINSVSNKHKYYCVYVDRQGRWKLTSFRDVKQHLDSKGIEKLPIALIKAGDNTLYQLKGNKLKAIAGIDNALLCFHGVNGEDGSIQGLLQLSNIPTCNGNVLSSSVSMDKIATKIVCEGLKINTIKWEYIDVSPYNIDKEAEIDRLISKLKFPIIVKPSNLGSSIGIAVCRDRVQLSTGLETAFHYDCRVLAEQALTDFYELNCSACRKNNKIDISHIEQPISKSNILSFTDKYLGSGSSKGMESLKRKFADDSEYLPQISRDISTIYDAINFSGVIRVDFIIDNTTKQCYLNEINSIPGSLSYYLWGDMAMLIDGLIEQSMLSDRLNKCLTYSYDSIVLKAGFCKGK